MKIKYCLMGSTTDPFYFDFWPIVSKVWKDVFDIIPVLGLICDEDSDLIQDEYGFIKKFKKSQFADQGTRSQIVRLYLSKFLNGNCIISDIDMIPLSKKYFIDNLTKFSDEKIVVMSSHHPQTVNTNQYPMCYVAGNSEIFNKVFNTKLTWDEFVFSTSLNGWYSDQIFLFDSIQKFGLKNVEFPYRSFINDRIDRITWTYKIDLVKNQSYIDSHLLRPFEENKNEIYKLVKLLYNDRNVGI